MQRIALLTVAISLAGCNGEPPEHMVGTLERDRIELTLESNEPIIEIFVTDGQWVEQASPILQQDPARNRALLNQQRALRDQAQARLAELRRGPRAEEIAQASARLRASEALTANALSNLEREQQIYDKGLGEKQALDLRRTRYDNARANEDADRDLLEQLNNGTTAEELAQAAAALAAAEAAVDRAGLDLERLTLLAPVSGTVDKVWYERGERPRVGTKVAMLLDDTRTYARIYVPEPLRSQMTPGKTLNIAIDGLSETRQGVVRWVSSDASFTPYFALTEHDRSRLSYLAEVDLPNAGHLPSGLPLEVWVP